jgi:hypothetical protein
MSKGCAGFCSVFREYLLLKLVVHTGPDSLDASRGLRSRVQIQARIPG